MRRTVELKELSQATQDKAQIQEKKISRKEHLQTILKTLPPNPNYTKKTNEIGGIIISSSTHMELGGIHERFKGRG